MSEEINYGYIENFKELLDKLVKDEDKYNENIKQIVNIFGIIKEIDEGLILQLRREIKNRTGIILREIDVLVKVRRLEIKEEIKEAELEAQAQAPIEIQSTQSNQNVNTITGNTVLDNYNIPNNEIIHFDDDVIIITNDKVIFFKKMGNGNFKPNTICDFKLDIISKVIDIRKEEELFSFKIGGIEYPSYNINGIIAELGKRIYSGIKGDNVISHIIEVKKIEMPVREAIYIPGWNNRWHTPMDEEEKNFTVIHYSEDQRSAWNNCKNMYKKYTPEEKEKLKKKLNKIVKLTEMPETYKAITIGLSLMVPFRLYFIKKFGVFPHVALWGKTTAGKSRWLDFWTTHFTKHRLNHMSGKTASSATRLESAMTGFTGAVMVDDYKIKSSYDSTDLEMILKDSATGVSLRKRLKSSSVKFADAREVISSIFTTSNELGELMLQSALLARTVSLYYNEPIEKNDDWIKLELELIDEKLFSILYDKTKNWTDKDLDKLVNIIEKQEIVKNINPRTTDMLYPKILSIYKIILIGCLIGNKWFGIKTKTKDILNILKESRRTVVKEFIDIFLSYCDFALRFNPNNPPRNINVKLQYDVKKRRYVFLIQSIRDFNRYYDGYTNERIKFKLTTLYDRLYDALEFKELVELKTDYWFSGRNVRAIVINPILICIGDKEITEDAEKIAHFTSVAESGSEVTPSPLKAEDFDNIDIDEDPEIFDPANNIETDKEDLLEHN